jgi:hypothetical protein
VTSWLAMVLLLFLDMGDKALLSRTLCAFPWDAATDATFPAMFREFQYADAMQQYLLLYEREQVTEDELRAAAARILTVLHMLRKVA